ncbi:transglutaminase-like cysteine peptidase [Photobacterium aphoticum]|uniref:transglutaminase-like cysteine peptidase n=1 Tax=Photobacterium aphoticum TaxID=754436 RepID=UPI000AC8BB08|nr:transglutaminase-like cysteine peptidase [Photobacterium aphoticum]GHA49707.1 sulfate adenylyltransferase [Photobacterium aphoticum]
MMTFFSNLITWLILLVLWLSANAAEAVTPTTSPLNPSSLSASALSPDEQHNVMRVKLAYGEAASQRVIRWRQLLGQVKTEQRRPADSDRNHNQNLAHNHDHNKSTAQPIPALLQSVNQFYNRLVFLDDPIVWGKEDYWATPLEFLGVGAGDCEDYSIAKYFSLRELGVADNKLRLIYVKALQLNQFHMVLAYYPTPAAVPLLLDNLTPQILRATERRDLQPIYSFNGSQLWLMKQRGEGKAVGQARQIKKWEQLRTRFRHNELAQPIITPYTRLPPRIPHHNQYDAGVIEAIRA